MRLDDVMLVAFSDRKYSGFVFRRYTLRSLAVDLSDRKGTDV